MKHKSNDVRQIPVAKPLRSGQTRLLFLLLAGFIPFGFFISWCFSGRGMNRRNVLLAVMVLGAGTSLFIDSAQSYLPSWTSQLRDFITNISGTAIGIFLWCRFIHHLLQSKDNG